MLSVQRHALDKFPVTDDQNMHDQQVWGAGGPFACDHSAICAFHTFLVEVQTNAGYIHAMHG